MDLSLFEKKYNVLNYHCVHFVIDAAKSLFNSDYSNSFIGLTGALNQAINASRQTVVRNKRLSEPKHGCIILMRNALGDNHVGIFYNGKVLHLSENGVQYVSIRTLKTYYTRFKYYEPIQNI